MENSIDEYLRVFDKNWEELKESEIIKIKVMNIWNKLKHFHRYVIKFPGFGRRLSYNKEIKKRIRRIFILIHNSSCDLKTLFFILIFSFFFNAKVNLKTLMIWNSK